MTFDDTAERKFNKKNLIERKKKFSKVPVTKYFVIICYG